MHATGLEKRLRAISAPYRHAVSRWLAAVGYGTPPLTDLLLFLRLLSGLLCSFRFSLLSHNVLLWVVVRGLHGKRGKTPRGYCFRKIEKTAIGCLFLTSRERGHLGEPGNRFPEGRFVPMLLIIDCCKRKSRSIQNCRIPLPKRLRSDCRRCSVSRSFATSSSTLIRATSYLALTAMLDNSQPCLAHMNSVSSINVNTIQENCKHFLQNFLADDNLTEGGMRCLIRTSSHRS